MAYPAGMDRFRFTTAGHRALEVLNPIGAAALEALLDQVPVVEGDTAVDLGCGKAAALEMLARRGVRGLGIDLNPAFLKVARRRLATQGLLEFIELVEGDLETRPPDGQRAVALCLGARVSGDRRKTLERLRAWVRPGGVVIVGDGYWRKPPARGYLELLGCTAADLADPGGNEALGESMGLSLIGVAQAGVDDFDRYEDAYAAGIERLITEHPHDPAAPGWRARIDRWRAGYRRWGRDTLGFGVYAFQTPG